MWRVSKGNSIYITRRSESCGRWSVPCHVKWGEAGAAYYCAKISSTQAKQDAAHLQEQSKNIKQNIEEAEKTSQKAQEARDRALELVGNYVHESVPVSSDEVCLTPMVHNLQG